ncbi:hypothetical protein Tco_0738374 [Tanacetum coccineum]
MSPGNVSPGNVYCLNIMSSADVARSHGGDGGGDDRPPSHVVPTGCGGCFANKGKGKRKPNLGGRGAGRLNTRDKTRNLSLKEIAVAKGPISISFEQGVCRCIYPSWRRFPEGAEAAIISEIEAHNGIPRAGQINEGNQQHLQKAYNPQQGFFQAKHLKQTHHRRVIRCVGVRQARPRILQRTGSWDKYIKFWNIPRTLRAAQNRLNVQKRLSHLDRENRSAWLAFEMRW